MALINCPNCGRSVSDKASVCPGCGNMFPHQEIELPKALITCEECGTEYEQGVDICPNCGCPAPKPELQENSQKVEVTSETITQTSKKKLKKAAIYITVVVVFAVILGVGIAQTSKHKAAETYLENMNTVSYMMIIEAAHAEDVGNLIKNVWYNAIYEKRDSKTDSYTRPGGYWVYDFNEALDNLFSDSIFMEDVSKIKDNQEKVNVLMKELTNPPDEYEDAYSALIDFHDAYINLTNLATNPTGSLKDFSTNFNDAVRETVNAYEKMNLYLD
jgi:uncharacterized OB-fold protein